MWWLLQHLSMLENGRRPPSRLVTTSLECLKNEGGYVRTTYIDYHTRVNDSLH